MKATVEIIKFIQHSSDSDITLAQQIEAVEQSLSAIICSVFDGTIEVVSKVVESDNIADWVINRCEQKPVDLVIKGGHRSESLFHIPSDWQLIRHLHCPLLIASHVKWKNKANILLAVDLSTEESNHLELNSLILSWGETWSKVTHNQLHAMYSIPIAKPLLEFDVVDKHAVMQKKAPAAKEKMQELLAQFDMSSVIDHISVGPPDRTILHQANELHSSLVILGSVARKGVSGLLLGNTAEKVRHHLRTDCLIIKLPHD